MEQERKRLRLDQTDSRKSMPPSVYGCESHTLLSREFRSGPERREEIDVAFVVLIRHAPGLGFGAEEVLDGVLRGRQQLVQNAERMSDDDEEEDDG
eukprot:3364382-Rhodomonas_salina.3